MIRAACASTDLVSGSGIVAFTVTVLSFPHAAIASIAASSRSCRSCRATMLPTAS
jgi:hypothetical protein